MLYYFNRGLTLNLSEADARYCGAIGDCTSAVQETVRLPKYRRQFAKMDPAEVRAELKEWGGWTAEELADDDASRERLFWMAAVSLREELDERDRARARRR